MPQTALPFGDQPYEGVRVPVFWDRDALDGPAHVVMVQVLLPRGDWSTLWVATWRGVMMDFVGTLVNEVTMAYVWGEKGDVLRAAMGTHRAACAHRREHEY